MLPVAATRYGADTQLNWLGRYVPLKPFLTEQALDSLLEVGSGHRGIGSIITTPFVGAEIAFHQPPVAPMVGIEYQGSTLPFKSGAFHTVLSMDTLEHVPSTLRGSFIGELTRVAATQVVLGFPADHGIDADRYVGKLFEHLGMPEPDWLHEHDELGLPDSASIEAILSSLSGWKWRAIPTTGDLASLLFTLADVLPGAHNWLQPVLSGHSQELEKWILAGSFGPSARKVYLLERDAPTNAIVRLSQLDSLYFGMVCPECGGDVELSDRGSQLACLECVERYLPTSGGAWQMISGSSQTSHVSFVLSPDWLGNTHWVSLVHNYLHAFKIGDPCSLWLNVDPEQLSCAEAIDLLKPVLAQFGEKPFAELVLNEEPSNAPRTPCIVLTADPIMAARWTPSAFVSAFEQAYRKG